MAHLREDHPAFAYYIIGSALAVIVVWLLFSLYFVRRDKARREARREQRRRLRRSKR